MSELSISLYDDDAFTIRQPRYLRDGHSTAILAVRPVGLRHVTQPARDADRDLEGRWRSAVVRAGPAIVMLATMSARDIAERAAEY